MSQTTAQDVFDATAFTAGFWGSGGYDGVGFYAGGTPGTGTAVLTGTAASYGDPISAAIDGVSMTLLAYADLADGNGIVLTDQNMTNFYVFTGSSFDPQASYPLYYGFGAFAAPCFVAGTRIMTPHGQMPVESLGIGDCVSLARGGTPAAITWIGRRHIACASHSRGHDVWPVRLAASAIGPELPQRDLLLSPDHAIYIGGVLVPARYLLNGATIVQEPVASVTYWHVELAAHDVLLAEGLACESYLDTGNRGAFDNHEEPAGAMLRTHPELARRLWRERACAPLHTDPSQLAELKQRLLARAAELGHLSTDDPDLLVLADERPAPLSRAGFTWQVRLPAGTRAARLVSRSAVPSEMLPDSRDHRRLGVAVTHLALDGAPMALSGAAVGSGWHATEPTVRWTAGRACLNLAPGGVRTLAITVAPLLRYWIKPAGPMAASRAGEAA